MVIGFNGMFSTGVCLASDSISASGRARVNIDYHLSFDGTVYSVPYVLTGELVEVPSSGDPVQLERFLPLRHGSQLRIAGDQG